MKIAEHRKMVEQLQKERDISRINVSQAAADLIKVIFSFEIQNISIYINIVNKEIES